MEDQGTSYYWRKILGIDQALPKNYLSQFDHPQKVLRPFLYFIAGTFFKFYCRENVRGLKNLPPKPPYVIASNHSSAIDYPIAAWAMGKRREELFPLVTKYYYDIAFPRFWIKVAANAVRIDPDVDFLAALRAAANILRAGGAVYVNPEGMRVRSGEIEKFRPGIGVLGVETGAPIVPVYIAGAMKVLPPGSIIPLPHEITVSFGKPIDMAPYIEKLKSVQAYDVYKEVAEEARRRVLALKNG